MSVTLQPVLQVKLLTDVLCYCIDRGRAATQLQEPRRRAAVEPLIRQFLLADGSLDLNGVWGQLLREPGVTERALASAFATLEDLQTLLQIPIRPTQRLQVLTPTQRQALLGECQINRADIERMIRHIRIEAQLASSKISRPGASPAASSPTPAPAASPTPAPAASPTPALTASSQPSLAPPQALSAGSGASSPQPPRPSQPSLQQLHARSSSQPSLQQLASAGAGTGTASVTPTPTPTGNSLTGVLSAVAAVPGLDADADREARVRAARALLEQANAEMKSSQRGTTSNPALGRGRTGTTPAASRPGSGPGLDRPTGTGKATGKPGKGGARRALIAGPLILLLITGIAAALVWRNMAHSVDLSFVTSLRLVEGKKKDAAITALIDDPRWRLMKYEQQRDVAQKAFREVTAVHKVHVLSLLNVDNLLEVEISDNGPGASPVAPLVVIPGANKDKDRDKDRPPHRPVTPDPRPAAGTGAR
jgi:hypothetical protein